MESNRHTECTYGKNPLAQAGITSWERTRRSRPLCSRKARVTSAPKATPTPRLEGARPAPGCGSLQSSSHIRPSSGGSLQPHHLPNQLSAVSSPRRAISPASCSTTDTCMSGQTQLKLHMKCLLRQLPTAAPSANRSYTRGGI